MVSSAQRGRRMQARREALEGRARLWMRIAKKPAWMESFDPKMAQPDHSRGPAGVLRCSCLASPEAQA